MHRHRFAAAFTAAVLVALVSGALAQTGNPPPQMTPQMKAEVDAYMKAATPGAPHQMLASMAGQFDVKVKSWHDARSPAMEESGSATRTMTLGGRVLVEEFNATMMGQPFSGHGMTGYDNVTGRYWSTWNDTMSTGIMTSDGTCDAQKSCTFATSWVDPLKKTPIKGRMTLRWTAPTTEVFEMYAPGPDGKDMKMMEITYTRK